MIWLGIVWLAGMAFCAITSALLTFRMVEELNARRPPESQVPYPIMTFSEWSLWFSRYGLWGGLGLLREYRREFPSSRIFKQVVACWVLMFVLVLAAFVWLWLRAAGFM